MKFLISILLMVLFSSCQFSSKNQFLKLSVGDVKRDFSVGDDIKLVKNKYGAPAYITELSAKKSSGGIVYCYNYKSFPDSEVSDKTKSPSVIIFLTEKDKITDIWFRY